MTARSGPLFAAKVRYVGACPFGIHSLHFRARHGPAAATIEAPAKGPIRSE